MAPKASTAKKSWGSGGLFQSREAGSLALIILTPILAFPYWYTCAFCKGDPVAFYNVVKQAGFWPFVRDLFFTEPAPGNLKSAYLLDSTAWKIYLGYAAFELVLQRWMPGKEFRAEGAKTRSGHVPVYKANGMQSYLFSILCLLLLRYDATSGPKYIDFNPAVVFDNMGKLLGISNILAFTLCFFLTYKGLNMPSTKDSGTNGSIIVDFFWGTELYPNILGWDVKQFTNCRFGMMFWQLGILCYAMKQYDLLGHIDSAMFVSVVLQTVYVAKFFWWETGYFQSMDIQHDRAGYYICWGCMVWVPSVYTMHTLFLVYNPQKLSFEITVLYILGGIFSVWCNYDCDRQRQEFRRTSGKAKIWGSAPEYIEAKFVTEDGNNHSSLLLASGWWRIARHFHYVPEITASIFWCAPSAQTAWYAYLPYFYPLYLTLLLLDRSFRDDQRCSDKYKGYWFEYCDKVPYKILPGII